MRESLDRLVALLSLLRHMHLHLRIRYKYNPTAAIMITSNIMAATVTPAISPMFAACLHFLVCSKTPRLRPSWLNCSEAS